MNALTRSPWSGIPNVALALLVTSCAATPSRAHRVSLATSSTQARSSGRGPLALPEKREPARMDALDQPGSAAYGVLSLDTQPPTRVMVDGAFVGTTPLTALAIPAGAHEVTCVNQELDIVRTVDVEITSGRTTAIEWALMSARNRPRIEERGDDPTDARPRPTAIAAAMISTVGAMRACARPWGMRGTAAVRVTFVSSGRA